MFETILVTGGAGFIGSNFVRGWLARERETRVVNLDTLTYAGHLQNLASIEQDRRHIFMHGSILDRPLLDKLFEQYRPGAVVHLAAATHVDRSLHQPEEFVQTNVAGTFQLLDSARAYWSRLGEEPRREFRFLHVSTDEVYGSLEADDPPFVETSPYCPNSPYSASKAGADHLVRAYHHTFGLPSLITNGSNTYGPRQYPEKLIPLTILNAVQGKPLPVYGDGMNRRDWLYVDDHCEAIRRVLAGGRPGQTYNVGGDSERANLEVVRTVCAVLQQEMPGRDYESLITFVKDRPGHDRRYAIDSTKLRTELGWSPRQGFEEGIRATVRWYLENGEWIAGVTRGAYQQWITVNYAGRK